MLVDSLTRITAQIDEDRHIALASITIFDVGVDQYGIPFLFDLCLFLWLFKSVCFSFFYFFSVVCFSLFHFFFSVIGNGL